MYGFNRSVSHTIVAIWRGAFLAQRASSGLLLRRLPAYLVRLPFSAASDVCASAIFVDAHRPNRTLSSRVGADSAWVQLRLLGQRFSVPTREVQSIVAATARAAFRWPRDAIFRLHRAVFRA